MRSFVALRDVRLGLQADHIFTAAVQLPADRYATAEQVTAFLQPLLARIKALPGVVHAAASTAMPPRRRRREQDGDCRQDARTARGGPLSAGHRRSTSGLCGSSSRQGRPLSEADVDDARKVAVVNETFVRKYLPNDDPIGQRVRLATSLETRRGARSRRLVRDCRRGRRRGESRTAGADRARKCGYRPRSRDRLRADADRAHGAGPVDPDERGATRSVGRGFRSPSGEPRPAWRISPTRSSMPGRGSGFC